jgi:hypothetical protein
MQIFTKTPNANLDYRFDWAPLRNGRGLSDWLATGETISTFTLTSTGESTVSAGEITDSASSVTVWVSGGSHGSNCVIVGKIVTSAGRTDERTMKIEVRQQ